MKAADIFALQSIGLAKTPTLPDTGTRITSHWPVDFAPEISVNYAPFLWVEPPCWW
jgi:hypothetical protein